MLDLLPESGLDVCVSFTPTPMTGCSFLEGLTVWQEGPLICGGFPQCWLEDAYDEVDFQTHFEDLLMVVDKHPLILGIGDAVMGNCNVERLNDMADRLNG